ncbi:MAG: sulfite exporter TauE/SafE family protein [Candidatus Methylacidiphilales bacterium]
MSVAEFTIVAFAVSIAAGFLGSLTGLGGGVVVIPALVLLLGVDMKYAIGASLISVIATSCGAAASFVRDGLANIRVGMALEIGTVAGALVGASLAHNLPSNGLSILFGAIVILVVASSAQKKSAGERLSSPQPHWVNRLHLDGSYQEGSQPISYQVRHLPGGLAMMGVAGLVAGLLGIGAGTFKVIALDRIMGLPLKVSTATSNFMIGVTAAASAGIYLNHGYLDPGVAFPVMLGVLTGAFAGARLLPGAKPTVLRWICNAVLLVAGLQMIYQGIIR